MGKREDSAEAHRVLAELDTDHGEAAALREAIQKGKQTEPVAEEPKQDPQIRALVQRLAAQNAAVRPRRIPAWKIWLGVIGAGLAVVMVLNDLSKMTTVEILLLLILFKL